VSDTVTVTVTGRVAGRVGGEGERVADLMSRSPQSFPICPAVSEAAAAAVPWAKTWIAVTLFSYA